MSKYSNFLGTHSTSNSRVTTREFGVIPNCTPAVDVFVDHSQEEVHQYLNEKADQYVAAVRKFCDGGFEGTGEARAQSMWEAAFKSTRVLQFLRNPAPKVHGNYYLS
jgi:hypothetical protein